MARSKRSKHAVASLAAGNRDSIPADNAETQARQAKEQECLQRLAEHDAEDAKAAKMFDPHELVKEATSIHEKMHPKHGLVKYGVLTTDELFSLDRITNTKERAKTLLWMMLRKAYPSLTREDVGKFPGMKSGELMNFLLTDTDFLPSQTGTASASGPRRAVKRRK